MDGAIPRVSVIIPNYRDFEVLSLCLDALQQQTLQRDLFEIIVADNNSPEGEAAVRAAVGDRARIVTITDKGAGCARNGGVAAARGEILAFTDSDCIPAPEWLASGIDALAEADLVGGRMVVLVDDAEKMTASEGFETVFAFNNELYVRKKGFSVTANLFCRRQVFEQVGGFLAANMAEDYEWCRRAVGKGYRLTYAPLAVVGHPARKTWDALLKKWRRSNRDNFGAYRLERRGGRAGWMLRSLALPVSAVVHSPRVLFDKRLKTTSLRLRVLVTLYRLRLWRLVHSWQLGLERAEVQR